MRPGELVISLKDISFIIRGNVAGFVHGPLDSMVKSRGLKEIKMEKERGNVLIFSCKASDIPLLW